jgi:hypothetical protein
MNKVQVLQSVADILDLNLFYNIGIRFSVSGSAGSVTLQGDLTADTITKLTSLNAEWSAHHNGWMQCEIVVDGVPCDITLIPS